MDIASHAPLYEYNAGCWPWFKGFRVYRQPCRTKQISARTAAIPYSIFQSLRSHHHTTLWESLYINRYKFIYSKTSLTDHCHRLTMVGRFKEALLYIIHIFICMYIDTHVHRMIDGDRYTERKLVCVYIYYINWIYIYIHRFVCWYYSGSWD